jgi:hypothetical protein
MLILGLIAKLEELLVVFVWFPILDRCFVDEAGAEAPHHRFANSLHQTPSFYYSRSDFK